MQVKTIILTSLVCGSCTEIFICNLTSTLLFSIFPGVGDARKNEVVFHGDESKFAVFYIRLVIRFG